MSFFTRWELRDRATAKLVGGAKKQERALKKTGVEGKKAGAAIKRGQVAARASVTRSTASIEMQNAAMRKLGSLATAAGAAMAAGFAARKIKAIADMADRMSKLATRTGTTTEFLSTLRHTADKSATSIEMVAKGVQFLNRAQADSLEGLETAERGFRALGISMDEVAALGPEEMFFRVATELGNTANQATKTQAAMALLGRSGVELFPLIDAIGTARSDAEKFKLVVTEDMSAGAVRFNDAMDDMKAAMDGIQLQLFTKGFQDLAKVLENIATTVSKLDTNAFRGMATVPLLFEAARTRDVDMMREAVKAYAMSLKGVAVTAGRLGAGGHIGPAPTISPFAAGAGAPLPTPAGSVAGAAAKGIEDAVMKDIQYQIRRIARRSGEVLREEIGGAFREGPPQPDRMAIPEIERTTYGAVDHTKEIDVNLERAALSAFHLDVAFTSMAQRSVAMVSRSIGDLVAGIKSANSFGKTLEGIFRSVVAQLASAAAFAAVMSAFSGGTSTFGGFFRKGLGFSGGGMVPAYAAGGMFARGTDTVPAMLTPGEGVLTREATRNLGGEQGIRVINATGGQGVGGLTVNLYGGTFLSGGEREFAAKIHGHLRELEDDNDYPRRS